MDWRESQTLARAPGTLDASEGDPHFVASTSPAMRAVEEAIAHIAATDLPVLIEGESGAGKEAVALCVHRHSRHGGEPFTKVACGTLTVESFEALCKDLEANNGNNGVHGMGTLFLDEITELTPACQAALLHAAPDGEVMARGQMLMARLVSATGRTPAELEEAIQSGRFRKDLFYRLNGVYLHLPPLRERREDIPALVEFFLRKSSELMERTMPALSSRTLQALQDYSWPGNIRELENIVRRMVVLGNESAAADLGPLVPPGQAAVLDSERLSLKEAARAASRQAEKELILKVLTETHWNRKRAARRLQISYKALLYKLRQMGLDGTGTS